MDHDGFSDDDIDFDALPQATLEHLEQQARLSTQQQPNLTHLPGPNGTGADTSTLITQPQTHRRPSFSDYNFNDEHVVDLDAQPLALISRNPHPAKAHLDDEVTQREAWRQQRYGAASHTDFLPSNHDRQAPPPQYNIPSRLDQRDPSEATAAGGIEQLDMDSLRARILELEQERANLQKTADEANTFALSRAGEISIVRANLQRATREYEQKIADLEKQYTYDAGKAKAELDAARREREKVETSNKFLEHDLAQEAERTRAFRKSMKDSHRPAQASPLSTPKKSKALAIRDGFDDDQVQLVSPSKLKDKLKPSTPRAGTKRKRPQQEKPANQSPSLSFSAPASNTPDDGAGFLADDSPKPSAAPAAALSSSSAVEKAQLLESILNHRCGPHRERTLESLSKASYPSMAGQSVSSLVLDQLFSSSPAIDLDTYRLQLCEEFLSLWSKCLNEKFYSPLRDLTELLQYILIISPSSLSTNLIVSLVPLCQQIADIVALPTAKASKAPSITNRSLAALKESIIPLDYLSILHLTALNCATPADLVTFWSKMEFDFILLMLHKAQPIPQIIEMLQLLFTSILDDTFGAIAVGRGENPVPDENSMVEADNPPTATSKHQKQLKNEADILDRLTVLLFETPLPSTHRSQHDPSHQALNDPDVDPDTDSSSNQTAPATPSKPYTATELMTLRSTVLTLLHTLSLTPHGAQSLSTHRLAIPRLVRFLHEAILTLYASTPSPSPSTPPETTPPQPQAQDLAASHVNTAVLLLARLNSADATSDIRAKLAAVPGGMQRWLVSLSRVAFAEGTGVAEAGLRPEVCEEAHRVLDEMLSPEEGDGVLGVFASAR